jgi:hypothetical protein
MLIQKYLNEQNCSDCAYNKCQFFFKFIIVHMYEKKKIHMWEIYTNKCSKSICMLWYRPSIMLWWHKLMLLSERPPTITSWGRGMGRDKAWLMWRDPHITPDPQGSHPNPPPSLLAPNLLPALIASPGMFLFHQNFFCFSFHQTFMF